MNRVGSDSKIQFAFTRSSEKLSRVNRSKKRDLDVMRIESDSAIGDYCSKKPGWEKRVHNLVAGW